MAIPKVRQLERGERVDKKNYKKQHKSGGAAKKVISLIQNVSVLIFSTTQSLMLCISDETLIILQWTTIKPHQEVIRTSYISISFKM